MGMPRDHNPLFDCPSAPEYRYEHDANFRSIVDLLHYFIQKAEFTPTEMREAALLACIHHDRYQLRRQYLNPDMFNCSETKKG